ncbi:hypothetical protein BDR03DRAFT_958918, partial [Suillus americanus]
MIGVLTALNALFREEVTLNKNTIKLNLSLGKISAIFFTLQRSVSIVRLDFPEMSGKRRRILHYPAGRNDQEYRATSDALATHRTADPGAPLLLLRIRCDREVQYCTWSLSQMLLRSPITWNFQSNQALAEKDSETSVSEARGQKSSRPLHYFVVEV